MYLEKSCPLLYYISVWQHAKLKLAWRLMNTMKTKKPNIVCLAIAAVLLALAITLGILFPQFSSMLYSLFSSTSQSEASREHGESLATQIVEEGTVLVKNDENTLPLDVNTDNKINVFGWAATEWVMGGSGSGRATNNGSLTPNTDFLKALEQAEIEYNSELTDMYEKFQSDRPVWNTGSLNSHNYEFSRLFEPSISDTTYYTSAMLANAESFSDVAVVVLGRVNGESNDAPTEQYKNYTALNMPDAAHTDSTRTYLDISTEEEELLDYVGKTYEKVIVIINSTNAMNLNFMDYIDGLDSCLIAGGTGNNAVKGLVNILYGMDLYTDSAETIPVSPSGRTVDTYAYDWTTNPAWAYTAMPGVSQYTNSASNLYPMTTTNPNVGGRNNRYSGLSYLDYVEGIYVGYKWYETADADGYWNGVKNEYGEGYEGIVQYPFGYGLSYTDFEWRVVEQTVDSEKGTITVSVDVTNTGNFAAKEVVELYYTPPYNKGGIEKSAINLAAFAKTPTAVKPGETQRLTLSLNIFDMASWDEGIKVKNGGYILEAGDYQIKLMKNSHEVANIDRAVYTYHVASDIIYDKDPYSGNEVKNLFVGDNPVDGIALDGSNSDADIPFLTRANFKGTFLTEKEAARAMSQSIIDNNLFTSAHAAAWLEKQGNVTAPTQGESNDTVVYENGKLNSLGLELGQNYNDPRWEQLLNKITVAEMTNLTLHGYLKESAIRSIGKEQTVAVDGPTQVGSFNQSNPGTGYPMPTVLGQTWNQELARSFGLAMGSEAKNTNRDGLYAPGINLHRSAFGGRNYEYFSEDSFLTGRMAAKLTEGALDMGVYLYAKHIIGYDQESYRDSLYCWMSEQALRETYLKPFKMAINEGGLTGLMTSYGRIGAIWSGGSEALCTALLRDEWGFNGAILTDYADHHEFMSGDHMIRNGGDLWMDGYQNNGKYNYETSSPAMLQKFREATHHTLYMIFNAEYESTQYDPAADGIPVTESAGVFEWWNIVFGVAIGALVIGAGVLVFFAFKKKKN